ncbi:MAG: tryptophan-rich sensory protein [Deltaproteobacteria bacterium]|nr:tryptophan-rich sensory protein [Deltaproteobacteria bacterium]
MTRYSRRNIYALLVFLAAVFLTAAVGGLFTGPNVEPMYQQVNRPGWAPPGWLFGPVWTVLYILIAVSGWLVWINGKPGSRRLPMSLYTAQLLLNGFWTLLYFKLRLPWLALLDIAALFFIILACIFSFRRVSPAAAVMMVPYALWTGFAAWLNFSIAKLNF